MSLTGQVFGSGAEQVSIQLSVIFFSIQVLNELCASGKSARAAEIANRIGVVLVRDLPTIEAACIAFVEANPSLVKLFFKTNKLFFFNLSKFVSIPTCFTMQNGHSWVLFLSASFPVSIP